MLSIVIKVVLATLLLICLFDMPYGYYQLVRFIALVGFGILAFLAKQKNKEIEMVVYGVLALLFQPFFKIALGRNLWNIIDVVVGLGLLISTFSQKNPNK